jgi:aspartyl-tRNA(Asn)/glutamyl-tRNA(Gln) amidotransferase subunit B
MTSAAAAHSSCETREHQLVVGLEVHVQLRTRAKAFCGCANEPDAPPNTHVCPVCLCLPGALPVLNEKAVTLATRAALVLGCEIAEYSHFVRKRYDHPDLPRGYQITQHDAPFATGGAVEIGAGAGGEVISIGISRLHIEEDAGRLFHDRFPGATAVDFNRAGVPLLEITTAPEIGSAEEAVAFLKVTRQLLDYVDVSDLSMEKGSFRVDANVSVRPPGQAEFGTRCEIKSMNSFSAVAEAVEQEYRRQCGILQAGGEIASRTLFWETATRQLREGRPKESVADYRYHVDPDLPPLVVDRRWVDRVAAVLPEAPRERRRRFVSDYALPANTVDSLTASALVANYFDNLAMHHRDPRRAAAWVLGPVLAEVRATRTRIDRLRVRPDDLADLLNMIDNGAITTSAAKRIFRTMAGTGQSASDIAARGGLLRVDDLTVTSRWLDAAVDEDPSLLHRLRGGERRVRDALVGRVMKLSGGAADPRLVDQLLAERLGE